MDVYTDKPSIGDLDRTSLEDAEDRASFRPIRSLLRGLKCLMVLNMRDGVTVSEIAEAVKLSRTTAHRILETLCEGGFVVRDPADDRYRATILVRSLADGFGDQLWVREIAKPELLALGRRVLYPVALATPSGLSMLVRETTDRQSPLALERFTAGLRLPMATSAVGRFYLALASPAHRETLLDILQRAPLPGEAPLRHRAELEAELDRIRPLGYVIQHTKPDREATLAVPVPNGEPPTAFLTMRYIASALTEKELTATHLPLLRETAARIADALEAGALQTIDPAEDLAIRIG